jgi:hypothetical protein
MASSESGSNVATARATADDLPAVLALLRRALGWTDLETTFLAWKHLENPFGPSPMWIARAGDRVVGFRAFLRWQLLLPNGRVIAAARAVDTATDPEFRARGIFTSLTLAALDSLRDEGVEIVFNTPNQQSLPGYVRMGWQQLGRFPVAVRPGRARFVRVIATARRAATRDPVPTTFGAAAPDALDDVAALDRLIASLLPVSGLSTRRTADYLRWRYGLRELGYRVLTHGTSVADGALVFRLRPRGAAVEAVVAETLVPNGDPARARALVGELAHSRAADYLMRLDRRRMTRDGFVRVPGMGPILVGRSLRNDSAPDHRGWEFGMGDVELL